MAKSKGVIWIALGPNAEQELLKSQASFQKHNRTTSRVFDPAMIDFPAGLSIDQQAHWAKVNADRWSPYDFTLLLDADTRIKGDLSWGFKMLYKGWDMLVAPSIPTAASGKVLWNLNGEERRITLQELGVWQHIMLNTGVMYFNKAERVSKLFELWRSEWLRYKDRDQGAFLRALNQRSVNLWLLGHPYNSAQGEVVTHLFGKARS